MSNMSTISIVKNGESNMSMNMNNGNVNGKEVRYVYTAEDLVFYTNTDEKDYPLYVYNDRRLAYKKLPTDAEVSENVVVFHVKNISFLESASTNKLQNNYSSRLHTNVFPYWSSVTTFDDIAAKYDAKIKDIASAMSELSNEVFAVVAEIEYEVYKGNYEEFVGNAKAHAVFMYLVPPYTADNNNNVKQRWAIAFSVLNRFKTKYAQMLGQYEKYLYVKKLAIKPRYGGEAPIVVCKIPIVTDEFKQIFNEAFTARQLDEEDDYTAVDEENSEEEAQQNDVQVEEVKLPELEVSLETEKHAQQQEQERTAVTTGKTGLVKVYLLSMKLPSRYLVQSVKVERDENALRETRTWQGEEAKKAAKIETLRRQCYGKVSKIFAFVEEYGTWIAVTEEAVAEARRISELVHEELKKLGIDSSRYNVKAITVYLEPQEAKTLLEAAVAHLSEDVEELQRRIEEAEREQKTSVVQRLMKDMNYRKALLESFKQYIAQLG